MEAPSPAIHVQDGQAIEGSSCPSYVCERCWAGLFSDSVFQELIRRAKSELPHDNHFLYVSSWSELTASANCNWCNLLLSGQQWKKDRGEINVEVRLERIPASLAHDMQALRICLEGKLYLWGRIYAASDDPAAEYIMAQSQVPEVDSPKSHALVLQNIEDCISNYDKCLRPCDQPLPTRLVDCADPLKPKLITADGGKDRYVAPSYVWGREDQVHKTTSRNVSVYLSGIELAILPQTIKDAVSLTHNLNCRYLWVDSLCIVQDSEAEKKTEIGNMRHLFHKAYFTIVAASSAKASEGFLQTRSDLSPATQLSFQLPGGKGAGTFYYFISTKISTKEWNYRPGIEPIEKRGWCLQEYLLAPRALVFTSHGIRYSCQSTNANVGKSVYQSFQKTSRLPNVVFASISRQLTLSPDERQGARRSWFATLEQYTQRSVGKPEDKFRAFAGIVELFHYVFKTRYLAGLWKNTLRDAMWMG